MINKSSGYRDLKSDFFGKTRDLFRKIRDTKKHFMQRWAHKERNGMDVTEAKDIKKR